MVDLLVVFPRRKIGVASPIDQIETDEVDRSNLLNCPLNLLETDVPLITKTPSGYLPWIAWKSPFVIGLSEHPHPNPKRSIR